MQDVLLKRSLLYFTTCVILYCDIVLMKDSDYLFSASICVTGPLFVTLVRTFLFLIQKAWFPMRVELKNMITRLYREKPKAKNKPSGVSFLCYLSQAFIFVFVRQAWQIMLDLFLSRVTFPSLNTRSLYRRWALKVAWSKTLEVYNCHVVLLFE